MKKIFLIWVLFLWCMALVWCVDIKDWPWMENEVSNNEWFVVAEWYCEEEWWEVEMWEEWWENQPVCFYGEDGSYCYLEDLYEGECGKWELYYFEDDYDYPSSEQICIDYGGQISQTEGWEGICILNDEDFCYLQDLVDWWCDLVYQDYEDWFYEYYDELSACESEWEDIVCGVDGNTYYNRCYLDFAWVKEETELAEVINGECVFG